MILEAYKTIIPSTDEAYIYEFRGRFLKPANNSGSTETITGRFMGKNLRSIYIAAENLYDAVLHLHTYRPGFIANEAFRRGKIKIVEREKKRAIGRRPGFAAEQKSWQQRLAKNDITELIDLPNARVSLRRVIHTCPFSALS